MLAPAAGHDARRPHHRRRRAGRRASTPRCAPPPGSASTGSTPTAACPPTTPSPCWPAAPAAITPAAGGLHRGAHRRPAPTSPCSCSPTPRAPTTTSRSPSLNAATEDDAVEVGRAVARSNLFKAAIFGNDPNWGRVLAASAPPQAAFDPDRARRRDQRRLGLPGSRRRRRPARASTSPAARSRDLDLQGRHASRPPSGPTTSPTPTSTRTARTPHERRSTTRTAQHAPRRRQKAADPRRGAAVADEVPRQDRRREVRRQRDDRRRPSSARSPRTSSFLRHAGLQAGRRARRRPADLRDARPARHRVGVPRRPAGHHARGDGRRPDGARRPGPARARRPAQPARPARRRPAPARTPGCSPPSAPHRRRRRGGRPRPGRRGRRGPPRGGARPARGRPDPGHLLASRPTPTAMVHNVNADTAAAALAVALGAEKLLVLTDVEGLYARLAGQRRRHRRDQPRGARRDAADAWPPAWSRRWTPACRPSSGGVPRATVVDGREPHAVLLEIFTDEGVGTQVLPGVPTKIRERRLRDEREPEASHDRLERPAASGTPPSLMNTFGPPQLVLTRGEGAHVWDADGKRVPRPARRHRGQRARPRATRRSSRRSPPSCATLGHVSNFFASPSRRSSSPSGCSPCSARPGRQGLLHQLRRRGQRGRVQADPAHRPHPAWSPPRAPSTAARWARSRSPPRRPTASRSSRCPATSRSSRTATSTALARPRSTDADRRGRPRADPGRGRRRRAARRLPRPRPRGSPPSTARCCGSTRCRPASAAPAHWFAHQRRRRRRSPTS